ncbi:unnamed protein product [Rotaria sp. Silwood1]|nr:unnamed protein product [Rotaria sp. Silwood1]
MMDADNTQWIKKRLHTLNPYVLFYSDIDRLSLYLETATNGTIILITAQASNALLSSKWNENVRVKLFHVSTFDEFEQVFSDISRYLSEILENKRTSVGLMLDGSLNISQRDVRNESFRILCYRMYKKILLDTNSISSDEAKSEFVTLCRNHYWMMYADHILQFENSYLSDDAVRWYTKDSFVYILVNRTLRTQDLGSLYVLRFYLRDLTESLRKD